MKITIDLPGPVGLTFEGDPDEFEKFSGFVSKLPSLVGEIGPPVEAERQTQNGSGDDDDDDASPLDPATLQARFSKVGASTDIDRVTVIAQAAVEAKLDGANFELADSIYDALALAKPARWKVTFGNARTKGYLQNVGRGIYKPTVPGQNYARGLGGGAPRKRSTRSVNAARRRPELEAGDDDVD
jgi:hypothetical protein